MFAFYLLLPLLLTVFGEDFTPDNFADKIGEKENVLVMFYAPWCGHCKRTMPDFDKAASKVSKKLDSARLGKVDCDAHKDLCSTHGVTGYPTLKVFKNGDVNNPSDYDGKRSEDGFYNFMETISKPATFELKTKQEYDDFVAQTLPMLVAYIKTGDKFLNEFEKLADDLRGKAYFAFTHSDAVYTGSSAKNSIKLVRPANLHAKFEDSEVEYTGDLSRSELKNWIIENGYGLVGYKTSENGEFFSTPTLLMFYGNSIIQDDPTMVRYYRNRLASGYKKSGVAIADIRIAYMHLPDFTKDISDYGASEGQLPIVAILHQGKKYLLDKFTMDSYIQFLKDFAAGSVAPYVKSQPIPESQDKSAKEVVAYTFEEIVNDKTKDVLLMVHAPWCGHCQQLTPLFEEAAEKLKGEENVVLARFDATSNDVPDVIQVSGFPTLFFFPKNKKTSPIKYEGPRTTEGLIQYVAKQSTDGLGGFDRTGTPTKTEL